MNSRLITEKAAGVSRKSLARRPPASELAAAKPVSRSEFTSNGVNVTAPGRAVVVCSAAAGAVCAEAKGAVARTRSAPIVARRRGPAFGVGGVVFMV